MLRWYFSEDLDTSRWGQDGGFYSDDCRYRWTYCRRWQIDGKIVCWICLNPGTGDCDDPKRRPTLRKIVGLSHLWGMSGVILVNLFAWRTTNPHNLWMEDARGNDIVGVQNNAAIEAATQEATITIAAWGNLGRIQNRATKVSAMIGGAKCLELTKRNQPRHPLFAKHVDVVANLVDLPRR